jgi:hypothetical protein
MIDHPDVSRKHGVFEKDGRGWFYRHLSETRRVATVVSAATTREVTTGGRVLVGDGDVVYLTPRVRLRLAIPDLDFAPGGDAQWR